MNDQERQERQERHRHIAKKKLGQNFLIDKNIIYALVNCINPQKDDSMIEIGPGLAALTIPLLAKVKNMTAIEFDADLLPFLSSLESLKLIHADILNFDFADFFSTSDKKLLRIVGNLPYNISTPIIFHLLKYKNIIIDMNFMLQKEVVSRLSAYPGTSDFGRLSVMVQRFCQVIPLIEISPSCFNPAPKVTSQFVCLKPYKHDPFDISNDIIFEKIVRASFGNKRKMLRNNLKDFMTEQDIEKCGIDPKLRAENLSIIEFSKLSNYITNRQNQQNQ